MRSLKSKISRRSERMCLNGECPEHCQTLPVLLVRSSLRYPRRLLTTQPINNKQRALPTRSGSPPTHQHRHGNTITMKTARLVYRARHWNTNKFLYIAEGRVKGGKFSRNLEFSYLHRSSFCKRVQFSITAEGGFTPLTHNLTSIF
jgi:hypothetical protein